MDLPSQTDILIVGAGPSGLALGAELWRLGAGPLIVDRQPDGANTSRAAVVHAHTLEVLERLGVVDEMVAKGLEVPLFRIRDRDRMLMGVDFSNLPTKYPFALMCPQDRTEAILRARLEALGGAVRRPVEVIGVQKGVDDLEVGFQGNGASQTVRTRWLVGCDGGHSVVRQAGQVSFEGGAYDASFVLADFHMEWPMGREEVSLFFSPAGLLVVAPLPDDRFRVVATMDSAPERPDAAFVQKILDERGPRSALRRVHDIVWGSRFHLQHRVATSFRQGRILLCGDAAHAHSPAGGQGHGHGDSGRLSLVEPFLLASRERYEAALEPWSVRRREIAKGVVTQTDRMTRGRRCARSRPALSATPPLQSRLASRVSRSASPARWPNSTTAESAETEPRLVAGVLPAK